MKNHIKLVYFSFLMILQQFFFQRVVKQSVSFVVRLKILRSWFFAQAVAVIIMVAAWNHLSIWHLLSGWDGSARIVKFVRVAGLFLRCIFTNPN